MKSVRKFQQTCVVGIHSRPFFGVCGVVFSLFILFGGIVPYHFGRKYKEGLVLTFMYNAPYISRRSQHTVNSIDVTHRVRSDRFFFGINDNGVEFETINIFEAR